MATADKDFKVKNGLVVQGSSATVAGNQVLTTASELDDLFDVNAPTPADGDSLVYDSATGKWIPEAVTGGGGTASDSFKTISVAGQNNVVADSSTDTLTFVAGTNVSITTDAASDSITINATDTNTVTNAFTNIEVAGQDTVSAESTSDTLTLVAGTNVTITTNATNDTITINSTGGGGGGASVTVSDTAPSTPTEGDLWYNSTVGKTYIYYDSFWVESNPAQIGPAGSFEVSATAPSSPQEGNVWYNSNDSRFYVYYDNYWIEASSNERGPDGRFNVSETAPTFPAQGDAWFNSSTGRFYIYYDGYWVENTSSLTGPSGVVSVTSPLTNSGTAEAAVLGINQSLLSIAQSQVSNLTTDLSNKANVAGQVFTGNVTAPALIPSSSTPPTNGMYLGAANQVNIATNSTNRLTIGSTGAATFTGQVTATGLVASRVDSSNEGGQIDLNRASDNAIAWSIDAFGNTTTPDLRFIQNGTTVAASINGSNQLTATPAPGTTTTAATGVGYMGIPQSSAATTGAYTLAIGDAGDHVYTTATRTVTIPGNTTGTGPVAFPIGSTIIFINDAGATLTLQMQATTTDTCVLAGTGTSMTGGSGSRTLAPHGMATLVKVTATRWYISGNGLS